VVFGFAAPYRLTPHTFGATQAASMNAQLALAGLGRRLEQVENALADA